MAIAIFCIPLLIAFYTVIFGLENRRAKNRVGFFALLGLAIVILVLPYYLLFIR